MIEQLQIRDLGVIADATLELGPGFTAITGETGAGKTMVVTALGLLMGERGDSAAVRNGASAARVGGLVRTEDPRVIELVSESGGEVEDGDLTLTRTVSAEGRSRANIGGATAPVGTLGKLSELLFAVHGQSEQLRLRSATAQRELLDRFGGRELLDTLADYRAAFAEQRRVSAELEQLRRTRDERRTEAERLRVELEAIEAVDPQPNEERELKERIARLSNLEELRAATASALRGIAGNGEDPYSMDASGLVDAALRDLERAASADARIAEFAETLRGVSFQLADFGRELAGYASDLGQGGPAELEAANERLAQLTALLRSYGLESAELLAHGASAAARLDELENDDELIGVLDSRLAEIDRQVQTLAARLTALRSSAAESLSGLVTTELRALALADAEFLVVIEASERGQFGADEVRLMLSPHPGAPPRSIAKGASGGELSRVMLALEVVVAGVDPVPTFVFDEVDAGVGGAAAIEIGRRLSRLAKTSQVIVVTHLAQVAAFAGNHLQISKDSAGDFTESSCRQLTGDARLGEMARLLSGLSDSESALAHAAELLELGAAA